MRRHALLHRYILCGLLLMLSAMGSVMTRAQGTVDSETLSMGNGTLFEILAQSGGAGAQHSWVLAKDGEFLQAGRSRSFRSRFTEAGRYSLSGEVTTTSGEVRRRTFMLNVTDGVAPPTAPQGQAIGLIPSADEQGNILLPDTTNIVAIIPEQAAVHGLTLDADIAKDADGDGNAGNDNDSSATYFSTDSLPLYLWLSEMMPVSVTVRGTTLDGSPLSKTYAIGNRSHLPQSGSQGNTVTPDTGGIVAEDRGNGSVKFRIDPSLVPEDTPILLHWSFGDGAQSMLDAPEHRFAMDKTYIVTVEIRELKKGTLLQTLSHTFTISGTTPVEISSASASSSMTDAGTDNGNPSGSHFWLLVKIIGVLLAAILVGVIIMVIVHFIRKGTGLAAKLEEADKKMAIKPAQESSNDQTVLPSMELQEAPEPEQLPPSAQPATQSEESAVPAWLRQGEASVPTTVAQAPQPPAQSAAVPDWLQSTPSQAEAAAPIDQAPPPPQAPSMTSSDEALPPWLRDAQMSGATAQQSPAPTEAQAQTVEAPSPAPAPESIAQSTTPQTPDASETPTTETSLSADAVTATSPTPPEQPAPVDSSEVPPWLQAQTPSTTPETPTSSSLALVSETATAAPEESPAIPAQAEVPMETPPAPATTSVPSVSEMLDNGAAVSEVSSEVSKPVERDIPRAEEAPVNEDTPVAYVRAESIGNQPNASAPKQS